MKRDPSVLISEWALNSITIPYETLSLGALANSRTTYSHKYMTGRYTISCPSRIENETRAIPMPDLLYYFELLKFFVLKVGGCKMSNITY